MKGTCNRQDPLGYSLKGPVPALKMPVTMMPKGSHLPTTPHTHAITGNLPRLWDREEAGTPGTLPLYRWPYTYHDLPVPVTSLGGRGALAAGL